MPLELRGRGGRERANRGLWGLDLWDDSVRLEGQGAGWGWGKPHIVAGPANAGRVMGVELVGEQPMNFTNNQWIGRAGAAGIAGTALLGAAFLGGCNNAGEGALSGAAGGRRSGAAHHRKLFTGSRRSGRCDRRGVLAGGLAGAVIGDQNQRNAAMANGGYAYAPPPPSSASDDGVLRVSGAAAAGISRVCVRPQRRVLAVGITGRKRPAAALPKNGVDSSGWSGG